MRLTEKGIKKDSKNVQCKNITWTQMLALTGFVLAFGGKAGDALQSNALTLVISCSRTLFLTFMGSSATRKMASKDRSS